MKQTINTKASKQCTMMPYEEGGGGKRKGGKGGRGGEGRGGEGRREILVQWIELLNTYSSTPTRAVTE